MIYQRYRLGTRATKCASYASSTASSAAASPQTVLSTSAVTSSHTLLGTHLVTSVVTSSRMGGAGHAVLGGHLGGGVGNVGGSTDEELGVGLSLPLAVDV